MDKELEKKNRVKIIIIIIILLLLLILFLTKDKVVKESNNIDDNNKTSALIYFDKLKGINEEKDSSIQSDTQVNLVSDLSSNTACQDIFTFKVYNTSKEDAYISSINIIDNDGVLNDVNYVIKDSNDNIVEPGTVLKTNTSTEYKIIISSKNQICPSKEIKLSLKFNFVYGSYKEKEEVSNEEEVKQNIEEENSDSYTNNKTQTKKESKTEQTVNIQKNIYKVTLNSINGSFDVILMNVLENESVNTQLNSKEGYHYEKVICSNNYNADVKDNNLSINNIKENINCTIYYTENEYKLNIDPNGGVYNNSTQVVSENRKYKSIKELNEVTKEGYNFVGWEIKGKNTKINNNTLTMGMDTTITAKWEVKTNKIIVKATNGTGGNTTVEYNKDTSLKVVANDGYSYDTTLGSTISCNTSVDVSYNQEQQQLEFKNVVSDVSCEINFIKVENITAVNLASRYTYTHGDEYSIVVNKDTNERHTFYVVSSTEDTVSLIMSENYTTKKETILYGTTRYPSSILLAVPTVEEWNNIPSPGIYTDNFGCEAVTIDYSAYAARIPTYGEIYAAYNSGGRKDWIKGNYWTSSPYYSSTSSMNLYIMYSNGSSNYISYKSYNKEFGYRPVITLPKSYFKGIVDENNIPNIVTAQTVQSNNKYTNGDKYSIVVNKDTNETHDFYVLKSDEDSVYLIMSENYTAKGTTMIYGSDRYPRDILSLVPTVSEWNNIPTPGVVIDNDGDATRIIDYSAYAARIPTYYEILAECATGTCIDWIKGSYWTSTPYNSYTAVTDLRYMNNNNISYESYSSYGGYRPVIKLPKTYFKNIINEEKEVNIVSKTSTISDNSYTVGDKYSVIVNKDTNETHDFYVLSVTDDKVNLIMSENYTDKGTTSKFGSTRYPSYIFKLIPTVEEWNNIPSPGQFVDSSGEFAVNVNYSAYAARIPTYHELLGVCANGTCLDWIKGSYWTSSPYEASNSTMNLYYMKNSKISYEKYNESLGYRPVISIPKTYFKNIINENANSNIVTKVATQNNYSFSNGDEYQIKVNSSGETHNFYVISSTKNTVSLIMSENYISKAETSIFGSERYPSSIFNLIPTVEEWNYIPSPGIFTDADGEKTVTINYGLYSARIPTYHEILGECLNGTCVDWIKGSYWTSSPYETSNSTMNLSYMNSTSLSYKKYNESGGYRPIITLPKTYFKDIIDDSITNNILSEISIKNQNEISSGDKYNVVVNSSTNENYDFYVLSANSSEVNLIMSENYTVNGETAIYGNDRYPRSIINLFPKISEWTNIPSPGTFKDDTGVVTVVVNYGMYSSRFPTYKELLSVCPSSTGCPTWIRGTYWTSSPYNTYTSSTNLSYMNNANISYNTYSKTGGYRPVITLPRKYFNK